LLLRLAEDPALYSPKWSDEILDEVQRVQADKLSWPPELVASWRSAVDTHFPEAFVKGYEHLIPQCTNHPKDRHVLAAAVHCEAKAIVTANLRDFPPSACQPFGVVAVHPDEFLRSLFDARTKLFIEKLDEIAAVRGCSRTVVLGRLANTVPEFSKRVLGS